MCSDARCYVSARIVLALFCALLSPIFDLWSWRCLHVCTLSCRARSFHSCVVPHSVTVVVYLPKLCWAAIWTASRGLLLPRSPPRAIGPLVSGRALFRRGWLSCPCPVVRLLVPSDAVGTQQAVKAGGETSLLLQPDQPQLVFGEKETRIISLFQIFWVLRSSADPSLVMNNPDLVLVQLLPATTQCRHLRGSL